MIEPEAFASSLKLLIESEVRLRVAEMRKELRADLRGEKGDVGPAGPSGMKGDAGPAGLPGRDGEAGVPGPIGPPGPPGERGELGTKGDPGLPGQDGDVGAPGPTGPQGAAGERGEKGDPGVDGNDGAAGASGADGRDGPQGPQGIPGQRGEKGTDGRDGRDGIDRAEIKALLAAHVDKMVEDALGQITLDGRDLKLGDRLIKRLALLEYRGVYREGIEYEPGHFVTWAGSLWHCDEKTSGKPGEDSAAWTLAVKHGRDLRA